MPWKRPAMKLCKRCNESKPLDEFPRDKSRKDGRFAYCKPCNSAHASKWHRENREKHNASMRQRYECEKLKPGYREKATASLREWRKKNPGHNRTLSGTWWAEARGAYTPKWADFDAIKAVYERAAREGKQVDHIIACSRKDCTALHWEGNLQVLSKTDNLRKGTGTSVPSKI